MILKDPQKSSLAPQRPPTARPKASKATAGWSALMRPEVVAPAIVGIIALGLWEGLVRLLAVPPYLLPGPLLVFQTLIEEWSDLFPSLLITLQITVVAFIAATVSGLLIAVLFTQSKWIERSFFPMR